MASTNPRHFHKILAIESSCDETSAAVYCAQTKTIQQKIYSQVELHRAYGGVVPEIASRSHLEKLYGVVEQALSQADCTLKDIDAIAYTRGPGLVGPLLIGACYADALAYALQVPLVPVHHLEAHITIALHEYQALQFPFLALLVSGGHTELILAESLGHYRILGSTMDDAAGEAFDKSGKIMGLNYPAGPEIAQLATTVDPQEPVPELPEPLKGKQTLDFSFSGLKTAFARAWQLHKNQYSLAAFAWAIEQAIVDALLKRVEQALDQHPDIPLVVAGGVAANRCLREKIKTCMTNRKQSAYFPSMQYCTDNAGMIVHNAYLRLTKLSKPEVPKQKVQPRWPIDSLNPW